MWWYRIMDDGSDLFARQIINQLFPAPGLHDKLMPDMCSAFPDFRQSENGIFSSLKYLLQIFSLSLWSSSRCDSFTRKSLPVFHLTVNWFLPPGYNIFFTSVIPKHPYFIGYPGIICYNASRIPKCSEIFGRIK